ncbi:MAG: cupin domain-containing protein [Janthinobacterium lividum]
MSESTAEKVDAAHSPHGEMGQKYLASGKSVAMRLWEETPMNELKPPAAREYETVGYVIAGRAELHLERSEIIALAPGDSWTVPQGVSHTYRILEPFTAVEATSPPAPGQRT